ncbi:MAG: esterase-like activity of phytase family protein [Burkholderiales bacterium]
MRARDGSISLVLLSALVVPLAHGAPILLAIGNMGGITTDLSTQTAGLLENGAPGNLFGGIGSGLAWAGGSTFIATPDRGPNATAYNPLIDDTTSYIARFQTLTLNLSANPVLGGLPFILSPTLTATTLLSSSDKLTYGTGALGTNATHVLGSGTPALNAINGTNYFTGRSDNFDPGKSSTNPNDGRLDPEGVRVSRDGKSIFVSDEYGPYVYQFDRATGQRIKSFALPSELAVTTPGPTTNSEGKPTNSSGRVANKGMEGLAITPDGKTLIGIMQAPLLQDSNNNVRIVTINIASGATKEFAYKLTTGSGVSEIVALNDHQFLVDERDGKGLGDGTAAAVKQLYKIDLAGATDVTGKQGDLSAFAISKTLFLDLLPPLNAAGITNTQIPAKIEGLAFGSDVLFNGSTLHTLFVANDNDFVPDVAGDSKFFVFGVSDVDLTAAGSSFTPQQFVPEPAPLALLGLGLSGMAVARKRKQSDRRA